MCLHYLHVSACMLHFHFGIEAADASRHDKAEGPEPPRLNTHGPEYPNGISKSCPGKGTSNVKKKTQRKNQKKS